MLFNIDNGRFYFEDMLILSDISVSLADDDRVGLIGENGSGKTTLLNILMGKYELDDGTLSKKRGMTVGYLEQNSTFESDKTVIEEMRSCFSDILRLEERMREIELLLPEVEVDGIEYRRLTNEYSESKKRFEGLDGYNVDVKIKTVLNGMGFLGQYDRVCSTFSGGEKTRLALSRLLLKNPELLILDEPTNHLDFSTLYWLEDYLSTYKGAILTVSHDRSFLDKVTEKTWELKNTKLTVWRGNYTKYKQLKDEWIASTKKEYEKQQEQIADMKDYVARNLVRATTAKSALSRVKKLESMEIIEKPDERVSTPTFVFEKAIDPTKEVVKIKDIDLSAGEKKLISGGEMLVLRGEKVGIIGENGAGKSTLLKRILESFGTYDDVITFGKNVSISYYDQENVNLNFEASVRGEMWDKFPRSTEYDIRRALGRMLFTDEDMGKKISSLSGGERAKLGFAEMMMKKSNLLILDEPTNHIDLAARESLEDALKNFDGTVIFVSHDRYFLESVADKLYAIENGELCEYKMKFSAYMAQKKSVEKTEDAQLDAKPKEKKQGNYRDSKARSEEVKRKNALKVVEEEIATLEERQSELSNEMQRPDVASDYTKLKPVLDETEKNKQRLDELYKLWESLS